MAFFKVKVGDTVYELDKLTMGDSRIMKHKFGVSDLDGMSSTDPDVITGFIALAIRRTTPGLTIEQATEQAEALSFDDFVPAEDEKEVVDTPLAPVVDPDASEAIAAPVPSGSPETTPEISGPQA